MSHTEEIKAVHTWNRLRPEHGATGAARKMGMKEHMLSTLAKKHGITLSPTKFRGTPAGPEKIAEWVAKMRKWKFLRKQGIPIPKIEKEMNMTKSDYDRWQKIVSSRGIAIGKLEEAQP